MTNLEPAEERQNRLSLSSKTIARSVRRFAICWTRLE